MVGAGLLAYGPTSHAFPASRPHQWLRAAGVPDHSGGSAPDLHRLPITTDLEPVHRIACKRAYPGCAWAQRAVRSRSPQRDAGSSASRRPIARATTATASNGRCSIASLVSRSTLIPRSVRSLASRLRSASKRIGAAVRTVSVHFNGKAEPWPKEVQAIVEHMDLQLRLGQAGRADKRQEPLLWRRVGLR